MKQSFHFSTFVSHPCGFTLIEILIAIVIIGILSMLGIATFQTAQKKGRDFNRKAGLIAVSKALESYMNDKGVYPPSDTNGKILWCGTSDDPDNLACLWGGSLTDAESTSPDEEKTMYLAALPKEPISSQTYFYEAVPDFNGLNKGYRLYALLENKQDPEISEYHTNCSSDPDSPKYCNYVLTSETVALPTPYVTATATPTGTATATPTITPSVTSTVTPSVTSTVTPTLSPTVTPTPIISCLAAGNACTVGGTACCSGTCTTLYRDLDGDGYGAGAASQRCPPLGGYVANNTDCYDANANAHPGQTAYFTGFQGSGDRGDGSWDYNCNGVEEKQTGLCTIGGAGCCRAAACGNRCDKCRASDCNGTLTKINQGCR